MSKINIEKNHDADLSLALAGDGGVDALSRRTIGLRQLLKESVCCVPGVAEAYAATVGVSWASCRTKEMRPREC